MRRGGPRLLFGCLVLGCVRLAAQDSLALRRQLLLQENERYIKIAQADHILTARQADSLREISSGAAEKPARIGMDILQQIRDYIDAEYEKQMRVINESVMDQPYVSRRSLLPSVLSIPEDFVSPEEREYENRKKAMASLAESVARHFEGEELPAWQKWMQKHFPIFFGDRAFFKGKTFLLNGQSIPVPPGRPDE